MANPVVHWEIGGARDAKRLGDFYSRLFGWNVNADNPHHYHTVDTGGGGINGGIMQACGEEPPYVAFYVQVDNLQAYLDKAVGLGGKALMPPTPIEGVGAVAMFQDLEGHCVGLFKR
ncbi:MAG TPA: VOC family protein [Gemmataceae bacterium]|nr:VOC family protein [Gemmataceae bacterium]